MLNRLLVAITVLTLIGCGIPGSALAQFLCGGPDNNVLTQHNNPQRTGANTHETDLTHAKVKGPTFGKLWEYPVWGRIYAQPLLARVHGVPPTLRDFCVVFIATAENVVYAFDAEHDNPNFLWRYDAGFANVALAAHVFRNDEGGFESQNIAPAIGIIGTPVIDLNHATMYFVAMTEHASTSGELTFVHTLHAIDIRTGTPRGKVVITGNVEGGGRFNSQRQNQRAALALVNNRIYIPWASFADIKPYDGFVMSYGSMDSADPGDRLKKLGQFQVARFKPLIGARHKGGGIWQSGGGPAIDGDSLYVVAGNGDSNNAHAGKDFDTSVVRLGLDLHVKDYFTPYNQGFINDNDLDLSVAGPMIPEDQLNAVGKPVKLLLLGSKTGVLYVLNRDGLGKYNEHGDDIIQRLRVFPDAGDSGHNLESAHIHATPVYWRGPDGPRVYVASDYNLGVRVFRFQQERLDNHVVAINFFPRAPISQMSLSANGSAKGTGILWFISSPTGTTASYPGILYAFNAETLDMLYSSETNPFDRLGDYPRFNAPTILGGKVYVPTFSNKLAVYGLCPASTSPDAPCRCRVCAH
jgi:hypothetical protein